MITNRDLRMIPMIRERATTATEDDCPSPDLPSSGGRPPRSGRALDQSTPLDVPGTTTTPTDQTP